MPLPAGAPRALGVISLRIRDAQADDAACWDGFVHTHADASFFHLFGWRRVLADALGHRSHYLLAEQDGGVCGILPLLHVKSFLFGNTLSSLAFCSQAGPLALLGLFALTVGRIIFGEHDGAGA